MVDGQGGEHGASVLNLAAEEPKSVLELVPILILSTEGNRVQEDEREGETVIHIRVPKVRYSCTVMVYMRYTFDRLINLFDVKVGFPSVETNFQS